MRFFDTPRRLAAVVLLLAIGTADAQTPAAKPAEGKTLSLGTGAAGGTGKLLTREELRACMKQRDALAVRLADVDGQRKALDAEREPITQERAALSKERELVNQKADALTAFAQRQTVYKAKVDDYQSRVTAFNDANRTGISAERQRAELQREQAELQKAQQALDAERPGVISAAEDAAKQFNTRATAVEAKAADWNQRNTKLNETGQAVADDRQTWAAECGNRRYREDDETAIRRGQ